MREEHYQKILSRIRSFPGGPEICDYAMRTITHATAVSFVALLGIFLFQRRYQELYETILVAAVSFLTFSVARRILGSHRPYEDMDIEPIVARVSRGDSFPSRHVFSIFLIAMAMLRQNLFLGLLFLLMGIVLALLRVLTGVHYPRDVIAGALVGILCGYLGWFLIF